MPSDQPRYTAADVRSVCKARDAWWATLVVDPLAVRIVPFMLRFRSLTPNRLTGFAIVLQIASGLVFLAGLPWEGALVFEAARFFDNTDGKVARLRGLTSRAGGFFDIVGDLVRMAWVYSAVGIWLAAQHVMPARLALLPALVVLVWVWSNTQLALHPGPPAPAVGNIETAPQGWLARHRLNRLPGSIDAAALALFIAPLTTSARVMAGALWFVVAFFYLPAACRNVAKVFGVLRREDGSVAPSIS